MADDKKKRGVQDRSKVSTSERYELDYEAKKMKTTPAKVKAAAKKVGSGRKKIEAKLKRGK